MEETLLNLHMSIKHKATLQRPIVTTTKWWLRSLSTNDATWHHLVIRVERVARSFFIIWCVSSSMSTCISSSLCSLFNTALQIYLFCYPYSFVSLIYIIHTTWRCASAAVPDIKLNSYQIWKCIPHINIKEKTNSLMVILLPCIFQLSQRIRDLSYSFFFLLLFGF